jgi:hypothetical protein
MGLADPADVRLSPNSGAKADIQKPPLRARNGLMRCNKKSSRAPFRLLAKLM